MIKLSVLNNLEGTVKIPPSKSLAHRALILASLAKHEVLIKNVAYSNDILATISCLENLGHSFVKNEDSIIVKPGKIKRLGNLNCNESGSTLRFMIPYALLQDEEIVIDGENRLKVRPIDDYFPLFKQNNVDYIYNDNTLPLTLKGNLKCGEYYIKGDVSSQFITGLLLTLPFIKGDSKVIITSKLESKPYVDMTIKIAKEFGVNIIEEEGPIYLIKGGQSVSIKEYEIEGDYSQAAFFLVANALGANLKLEGLRRSNMQGDEAILDILEEFGVTFDSNFKAIKRDLKPAVISLQQNPDLGPILGVLCSSIKGESKLVDLERLAFKESNRITATVDLLNACGVNASGDDKSITVIGPTNYKPGEIDTVNDHRIVMSSAVMAMKTKYLYVNEIKPVNKSFPNFFNIYKEIGGEVDE